MASSQSDFLGSARASVFLSKNELGRSCMGQKCGLLPFETRSGRDAGRSLSTWRDPSVLKLLSAGISKISSKRELKNPHVRPVCGVLEATETPISEAAPKEHVFQAWNVETTPGLKGQKRTDLKKILILGAGPIVIGQACEFGYSGTQACKALKEEGYNVVLINSNPATITTDPEIADRTYITSMTPELVEKILEKERPDAILPTMGGQTALNLAVALSEKGILEKYGIELIGAKLETIKKAEDRDLFKQAMNRIGVKSPPSGIATTLEECYQIADTIGEFPLIIRPAFTLGGTGGGIAYNKEEFEVICKTGLAASLCSQVSVEKFLLGWKEYELEMMRDLADNVVIICSIENIDPMGVHTGDSITVAPAQTLTDKEYQCLRDQAVAIMREIGVECGGSNVQFVVNPKDGEVMVIEINPRVSRSSALASKATGFPIAKMAAKLSVGYTLDLIPNGITKRTPTSFEPSIDYVVTKRKMDFPETSLGSSDKYPMVDFGLNTSAVKSKSMNPLQPQVQTLIAEASSPSMIEDEVLEDDESIIGGTDVSALVRKVPSEPSLRRAIRMIDIVMDRNIRISINTFSALLQRCSRSRDLISGKKVHEQLLENNYKANVLLANMLIDMYGKCGSVEDAQRVFDEMSKHNIYSWTALISAYANKGMLAEATNVFMDMQNSGNKPDKVVFVVLLQACARNGDINRGKQLHRQIRKNGLASDLTVGNTLIDMYAKCGSLELAHEVFKHLPEHNVVSWTALIAGYAREGCEENAFRIFDQMLELDIDPNEATFVSVLQACVHAMDVERGEHIHRLIVSSDYESDLVVSSSLVDMYIKCGNLMRAGVIFNKMYERNIVTWNSMIVGHVQQGFDESALLLYEHMLEEGFESADEITYANVIKACSNLTALEEGLEAHHEVIKWGHDTDTYVGNSLISFYSCCNCMNEARLVFGSMMERDVVTWTSMILGYAQQGLAKDALIMFHDMRGQNLIFEVVTFVSLIKACALVGDLEWGRQLHALLIDYGICLDAFVGSVLIDMYANCSSLDSAHYIFNTMPQRDVISYTAMIAAFAQQGQAKEALSSFEIMQLEGVEPDRLTFVAVLQACASLAAMDKGGQVHLEIIDRGLEMDVFVASTLVDMYAKCGRMDLARHLSTRMPELNVVSWNALISGYSQQGHGKEAVTLFKEMLKEGLKPTGATLVSVLSACSHTGFVDEGRYFFDSIGEYGIAPTMDHYACMVDLLCRAGHMVEAEDFILKMPVEPSEVVWMTLACAYKLQGKVDQAKKAIEAVLKLNPKNLSAYVLLSNILATAGMWEEKTKVRQMMENQGVANVSEHSSIEVNNQLYTFSLDDQFHPRMKEIHAELERLDEEMQDARPRETGLALHNEAEVCHHMERLAIGLGLISTPENSSIRVIKNARVCSACHRLSKFISTFTGREILVRDAGCFHLFKNGTCSCRDYW